MENSITNRTDEENFSELMKSNTLYYIPFFQREYTWDKEIVRLFEDIEMLYQGQSNSHFMGTIIINRIDNTHPELPSGADNYDIIDGQQRITTLFLIVLAIVRYLSRLAPDNPDSRASQALTDCTKAFYEIIYNTGVTIQNLPNVSLTLSRKNFQELKHIIEEIRDKTKVPELNAKTEGIMYPSNDWARTGKVNSAFKKINKLIAEKIDTDDYESLIKMYEVVTKKISVVKIVIKNAIDGPKIYQSLNSNRKATTIGELVRNEIFRTYKLSNENDRINELKRLHDETWEPFHDSFKVEFEDKKGKKKTVNLFENYLFPFAVAVKPDTAKDRVFDLLLDEWSELDNPSKRIQYLKRYKREYLSLESGECLSEECSSSHRIYFEDKRIKNNIKNLFLMGVPKTIYPFLIRLLNETYKENFDKDACHKILNFIESFICRRGLCGIGQTSLSLCFRYLWGKLENELTVENIAAHIKDDHRTITNPNNDFIWDTIRHHNVYKSNITDFVLRELNNFNQRTDLMEGLPKSIEHILPQSPGHNWHEKFSNAEKKAILNTLPNLLPCSSEMNESLSNKPFDVKKSRYANNSAYAMTRNFAQNYPDWNMDLYEQRSKEIYKLYIARFKDYFV